MLFSSLKNRNAIITGSVSGVGLGIAKILSNYGCNIMLNGFADEKTVDACFSEIKKNGVLVDYSGADISKKDEVKQMIQKAEKKFSRSVDILINNAGIQHVKPVEEFEDDMWDKVLAVNLSSSFYATKYVLPSMRKNKYGRIINISSAHGKVASIAKSAYVVSKHGINGLTKVVALETAGSGVTCNSICPGWVLTPLVQAQIEARMKKNGTTFEKESDSLLFEKQPSKQFVKASDIGELCAFLCTEAANQITGADYSIDGGWTIQ